MKDKNNLTTGIMRAKSVCRLMLIGALVTTSGFISHAQSTVNSATNTTKPFAITRDSITGKVKLVPSNRTQTESRMGEALNQQQPAIGAASHDFFPTADPGIIERVSLNTNNQQFQAFGSAGPAISADGRFVAFETYFDEDAQIYLRDLRTNTTELISVNEAGAPGNGYSFAARISATGRYVVFASDSSDLVPNDTNGEFTSDVFVRDRLKKTTERVSVSSTGEQANGDSFLPVISADGRFVAYQSTAPNLVAGDTNEYSDIFLYDRRTKTTTLINRTSTGAPANEWSYGSEISADGAFISYMSRASNLVPNDTNYVPNSPNDPQDGYDGFVYNRLTGETERINVSSSGEQAVFDAGAQTTLNVHISPDGRYVVFASTANNLVADDTNNQTDVFVRDRARGTTERVSVSSSETEGNDASSFAAISLGGRYVTFNSKANNLVDGDTNNSVDVFVRDRWRGTTKRVSVSSSGEEGNADSGFVVTVENLFADTWGWSITWSGDKIAFSSKASNLVENDTNEDYDVFVRGRR